jgi:hypothetical protein
MLIVTTFESYIIYKYVVVVASEPQDINRIAKTGLGRYPKS